MGALPANRIRGGVILIYFALVNDTGVALVRAPRERRASFPSTDQPKSQTTPEVKVGQLLRRTE